MLRVLSIGLWIPIWHKFSENWHLIGTFGHKKRKTSIRRRLLVNQLPLFYKGFRQTLIRVGSGRGIRTPDLRAFQGLNHTVSDTIVSPVFARDSLSVASG